MRSQSDIAVFVEVVARGSFTAAAASLEMSKAAVSKTVAQLEKRLGSRLLHRTTRRLTLTEAGSALFDGAGAALEKIVAAEDAVIELAGEPRGRLKVTAPIYFGATLLVPTFGRFLQRYPNVELELDLDNRIVDLVAGGFDLAIRITTLTSSSLVARRLADVSLATVASPRYLRSAGTPTRPADLRDHQCLLYTLDRTPNEWHYQDSRGEPISVPTKGGLRCNNDEALKEAALNGLGIARFPILFVNDVIATGRLVPLLSEFEPPPSAICAVFPSRRNLAPKVRVFVDFLAESLSQKKS
ncbi:MAG: LysR family transcriptional regulator [Woeseia sp.]|nr:LysR family transcriptional regulator [Woeseia sp.]